jgi:hypothetical protein
VAIDIQPYGVLEDLVPPEETSRLSKISATTNALDVK